MVKLRSGDKGDATTSAPPPALQPLADTKVQEKADIRPVSITKTQIASDLIELPDPTALDNNARKAAFNRLKTAPEIAKTIETAIETFGPPLFPQHLGLQLLRHLGVPVPREAERELLLEADTSAAALPEGFRGALSPAAMDLLVTTSLASPKETPTADTLLSVLAASRQGWASRITELADRARREILKKQAPEVAVTDKAREAALRIDLPLFSSFGKDYSKMEAQGLLERVVGREVEVDVIMDILGQRKLNSLILSGSPGVGKSAIGRGLAKALPGDRVFNIKGSVLAAAVSQSPTRGDPRIGRNAGGDVVDGLLKEVARAKEKGVRVILFIDEIHALAGAQAFWDRIKPVLSEGDLQIVGATDRPKEIYKDSALKDRFREVPIDAPNDEDALKMVLSNLDKMIAFHGVEIDAAAPKTAVECGKHFDIENPRGAELAIDAACSMVKRLLKEEPPKIKEVKEKITSAELAIDHAKGSSEDAEKTRTELRQELNQLTNELDRLQNLAEKERGIHDELGRLGNMLEGAMKIEPVDPKQVLELQTKIREQRRELDIVPERLYFPIVDAQAVLKATSKQTRVDVSKSRGDEKYKFLHVEDVISKRVIGLTEVKKQIAIDLRNDREKVRSVDPDTGKPNKPIGMRILLGPTGVGKTELAEALAQEFFHGNLIRINGPEYAERHELAKLKGAPPGYVGFDIGSFFAEQVRTKKRAVVLLDELEKAHPEMNDFLMQILDKGGFFDNEGRWVDCTNLYFVATSNAGALEMMHQDPSEWPETCVSALFQWGMKPEQLQRWSGYHVCPWLTKEAMDKILDVKVGQLEKQFAKTRHLKIEVSNSARARLLELGFDKVNGGRPLVRALDEHFRGQLSLDFIEERIKDEDFVAYDLINEELRFRRMTPDEMAAYNAKRAAATEERPAEQAGSAAS